MSSLENQDYWLGVRINHERYALPASHVHSVFLCPEAEQSIKDLKISGVVVHEGEPVYLRNHFQLLKTSLGANSGAAWQQVLKRDQAPWVVVLKEGPDKGLGFRVNNIVGPFHCSTFPEAAFLHYNGSDFHLVEVL
jgi:chemotaxis protein histidine kinase CheA